MLMIEPPPDVAMCRLPATLDLHSAPTFRSNTCAHSSSVTCQDSLWIHTPALLKRMSIQQSWSTARCVTSATSPVMSASIDDTARSLPVSSRTAAALRSASRATMTTRAPASARAAAMALPSPRLPPVTSAFLPVTANRSNTRTVASQWLADRSEWPDPSRRPHLRQVFGHPAATVQAPATWWPSRLSPPAWTVPGPPPTCDTSCHHPARGGGSGRLPHLRLHEHHERIRPGPHPSARRTRGVDHRARHLGAQEHLWRDEDRGGRAVRDRQPRSRPARASPAHVPVLPGRRRPGRGPRRVLRRERQGERVPLSPRRHPGRGGRPSARHVPCARGRLREVHRQCHHAIYPR